ncbi:hypothetical protein NDU88_010990 [Pleurodeles waltl]|uniref:Uncharacterized protein n=1 Tax=Pleurodeles waltl TaxID=8319 RepID=A0AAV7S5L7_PLEWA|nr:hypothetical protein NDU88_010990 [Pleurodeles waltl]
MAKRHRSHSPDSDEENDYQLVVATEAGGSPAGVSVSLFAVKVQAMVDAVVTKALSAKHRAKRASVWFDDDPDSDSSADSIPERHVVPGRNFISRDKLVDILSHIHVNLSMAPLLVDVAVENLFPQFAQPAELALPLHPKINEAII